LHIFLKKTDFEFLIFPSENQLIGPHPVLFYLAEKSSVQCTSSGSFLALAKYVLPPERENQARSCYPFDAP